MKLHSYVTIFCLLTFAITVTFVTSCGPVILAEEQKPMFRNLVDGRNISLDDMKGYVLIIDFWATWCVPCRTEIPWFIELYDKYKDKRVSIIGISLDKGGTRLVKKFIEAYGVNYPVIMATPKLLNDYQKAIGGPIEGIPTTLVIDRAGEIKSVHVGIPRDADPKGVFEREIQELLGEAEG